MKERPKNPPKKKQKLGADAVNPKSVSLLMGPTLEDVAKQCSSSSKASPSKPFPIFKGASHKLQDEKDTAKPSKPVVTSDANVKPPRPQGKK